MKTVLFADSSNYEIFTDIAGSLSESGLNIMWITSGSGLIREAVKQTGLESYIFDISDVLGDSAISFEGIEELEQNCVFTVSALIQSDPHLCALERAAGYSYCSSVFNGTKNFIAEHSPETLVTFTDNATAYIVAAAFRSMGKKIIIPFKDDGLTGKYIFFRDELMTDLITVTNDSAISLKAKKVCDKILSELNTPKIEKSRTTNMLSPEVLSNLFNKFKNSIKYKTPDMTELSFIRYFERKIFIHRQSGLMKRRGMIKDASLLPEENYGVFLLQPQPLPELDMRCTFHGDLFKHIADISKLLPSDKLLVVKECPNAAGDRVKDFYEAVKSLPNTLLAAPEADLHHIIRNADFVSGVCHSSLVKSAVAGTPAIAFCDSVYSGFSNIHYCRSLEQLNDAVQTAISSKTKNPLPKTVEDEELLKKLVSAAGKDEDTNLGAARLKTALFKI